MSHAAPQSPVVTTSAVEARHVTRSYQLDGVSVEALRGVTLRIEQGDYVAIIGPSGSGTATRTVRIETRATAGKLDAIIGERTTPMPR